MDTKYSHLVQIGEVEQAEALYFEDYAHTYLKKQENSDKLYLYGEIDKEENKVYIYGVADRPKLEQEFFQEYVNLGYLTRKEEYFIWHDGKKEKEIKGYYIFYATNVAMQEYLIRSGSNNKEEEKLVKEVRRKKEVKEVPVKEILLTKAYGRSGIANGKGEWQWLPGGIILVLLVGMVMFSENGKKKIEVFKEIAKEVMVDNSYRKENMVIEEKIISTNDEAITVSGVNMLSTEETDSIEIPETIALVEEETVITEEVTPEQEIENEDAVTEKIPENKEEERIIEQSYESVEDEMEEYIVEEGDTLAAICKRFYGTTEKMEEVCSINNIINQDYIAPGQKLYLPK